MTLGGLSDARRVSGRAVERYCAVYRRSTEADVCNRSDMCKTYAVLHLMCVIHHMTGTTETLGENNKRHGVSAGVPVSLDYCAVINNQL